MHITNNSHVASIQCYKFTTSLSILFLRKEIFMNIFFYYSQSLYSLIFSSFARMFKYLLSSKYISCFSWRNPSKQVTNFFLGEIWTITQCKEGMLFNIHYLSKQSLWGFVRPFCVLLANLLTQYLPKTLTYFLITGKITNTVNFPPRRCCITIYVLHLYNLVYI